MRTIILTLILFGLSYFQVNAQETLWATELVEVSSEKTDASYSPKNRGIQILGIPNVYPQTSPSACAWQPSGSNFGEDYIRVKFEKAIVPKTVAVVENINPGAIVRIFGYTEAKKEILLYQNTEPKPRLSGRLWNVRVNSNGQPIREIKLLIDHLASKGVKQYDAVAMTSGLRVEHKINTAKDIPQDLKKENLGSSVNSLSGEVAPMITADGNTLFFTRLNHPENIGTRKQKNNLKQDVWYSQLKKDGTWAKAINIGAPINNEFDNALVGTANNGTVAYLLNEYGSKMSIGLSKSVKNGKGWSMPTAINIKNFQALEDNDINPVTGIKNKELKVEFSVSQDEAVIIMGLKRSESYGGRDLYVSFKEEDGSYSRPKNLGPMINTAEMEGAPFLSFDKETLYFSSKGHSGYGNADIFIARRLDDSWTKWSQPQNLGPKINSPNWDGFFAIPASGDFGYISSKTGAIGSEDIFRLQLPPSIQPKAMAYVHLHTLNAQTKKGLAITTPTLASNVDSMNISLIDLQYDPAKHYTSAYLPMGATYSFVFSKEGFLDKTVVVDLRKLDETKEQTIEVLLKPIAQGQKMVLENVNFDQGKFEIKKSSIDELQDIISIMKKYPDMVVLLEGHTDNQGDFSLNVKLAKNRVNEVKNYLSKKGNIAKSRIQTKSWGPLKPIASNTSPEMRKKNRRVEFTILKM